MAAGAVLTRDWFLTLVFALLFVIAVVNRAAVLERLEYLAYDAGLGAARDARIVAERIVVAAIDDDSIHRIGRWPWPRSVLAEGIDRLTAARAKTIGLQLFLDEPQVDRGLGYIHRIGAVLDRRALQGQIADLLRQADQELNTDRRLAEAIGTARRVVLPMAVTLGRPAAGAGTAAVLPPRHALSRAPILAAGQPQPPQAARLAPPLAEFGEASAGLGHLLRQPDVDGAIRREALVIGHRGAHYPSLALLLAAHSLDLRTSDIALAPDGTLRLGALTLDTGPGMQLYPGFHRRADGRASFPVYSFSDIRDGKIASAQLQNRIVLIGVTATGLGERHATPVSGAMSGPELTAHVVASLLNQDYYRRPVWAVPAEGLMYAAVLGYLLLAVTRLPAAMAALVSLLLVALLLAGGHYLLLREQLWLKTASPALMLVLGHLLLAVRGRLLAPRLSPGVAADHAQTNRMLGLAFQNQGQLDMALDKFRALPVDDSVLDLIYNLALDFERKRQFGKAVAAYDYLLGHNPQFRDAAERRRRAEQVDRSIILGGGRVAPGTALLLGDPDHKPVLGRYEIEREIGRGAMGAVYLGRDPRINRVVAIKTLALSAEYEGTDLEQARARFFREAETAGQLKHPNIVTIYDAGEEHDLAYIAMEYLEGRDLTAYVRPDGLLPVAEAAEIICRVAEALAYAQQRGVVHRDIKPANIMYDPATHSVKVTDFGIARVTAASQTRTGVVLGSPSYMSPEQLAGQAVDGRSDLFSLGVTAFELLTGRQPFEGDTLAALMYQITNQPHPDPVKIRRELPGCLRAVLDRALAKEPEQRYQTGNEFSEALHNCVTTKANKKRRSTGVA